MINWNKVTKKDTPLLRKIAQRARGLNLMASDYISMDMDITAAHITSKLKLKELLEADDFNFAHDICGIQRHINRDTGEMENCFLPRFTV